MGTMVGHVAPGFGFFIIGLWHLFNHIKLHLLHPNSYTSLPWFPTSKFKYLELFLIMGGCTASIAMELFIGPTKHQPLDSDGTIPSNHLHNFEHSSISLAFFVYSAFALVLDQSRGRARSGLTQLLGGAAFAQQLLLFHLHSADHLGPEGQYHLLLQLIVLISLLTTLIGVHLSESFLVSFVRSISIMFQGVWLIIMGFVLWTPFFIFKGCFMHSEEGHKVVRCTTEQTLHRAKSLVNLQFSWVFAGISIFSVCFYLFLDKIYRAQLQYFTLTSEEEEEEEEDRDIESQKKSSKSFVQMAGKTPSSQINLER